ncbi:MAG: bifunctional diaminohydroxyphosphoribosylaminopyrimidine deaminase/5-amino-6-(5-phosphoribosylamino)uracil reductase RibD [Chthoniobacterales bacterium]|nr:bifunctional diaminohydroxyphosphoribosylaminopyrimidine deaminase/5-amino-6-(5-phosphoribosylamino)uracil reductase RibD [Chthoniobacterales bacterium]
MTRDEKFMREAIRLACKGHGHTRPNPAVGCVIVKDGRIIGRGWHRRAGAPHAEIEALRSLKNSRAALGATLYVTLEPCSTRGRTGPCTEALIAAGVARVVAGAIDPNPKHRGRGLRILRKAGLALTSGVLDKECAALNPEFNHFMSTGRPWVVAKCGMSLDGRLSRPPGESQWITSKAARADAMKLRARVDAMLVGANTVRTDDPALTVRGIRGAAQPWRVIWAPRGRPPAKSKVFKDRWRHKTIVATNQTLKGVLRDLAKRGIQSVLVEGGGHTLGQLFKESLADEVTFYIAPLLAGGPIPAVGSRPAKVPQIVSAHWEKIGQCLKVRGIVQKQRKQSAKNFPFCEKNPCRVLNVCTTLASRNNSVTQTNLKPS